VRPAIALETPRLHRVRTPEGIALPFVVASAADRVNAFALDLVVIAGGTALVWIAAALLLPVGGGVALSLALLASFFLRNFYFIAWEVGRSGVTLGKRKVGLRVISRDGGPLTAEAVFARNLTRDLEFFLPLTALLAPQALLPDAPGWGRLLACSWLFLFAFLPLFGRERLRCGDLVAGTLVVRAPALVLLPDLAEAPAEFAFTREQLDIYGIHELQVLEDLLRRDGEGSVDPRVLAEVGEKIQRKIGWPAERAQAPVRPFLAAFYRAQRGRLEQKLLFGQRQERKRGG
jgi:uncharacterized RDD family membrane protein YckC